MSPIFAKGKKEFSGWIIISIIVVLILGTIFVGRFFKSEEKIKLKFKNGQTLSFLVISHNDNNIIKGAFALFYQTRTNRCSIVSILPKTYIHFGEEHGYYTLEEAITKKVNYEDMLEGVSWLLGTNIDYYLYMKKNDIIRFVDLIKGVEIYTQELKFPAIKVSIPAGVNVLDGDKTIEYLSFQLQEEDDSEYKQLKRTQNFIRGLLKLKVDFLEQFNEQFVANYIYKTINTNMAVNDLIILYNEIVDRYNNGIRDYSIGYKDIILYCDKKNVSGYEYIFLPKKSGEWIKVEVEEVLESLLKSKEDKDVGHIVVEILNGTDIVGLAARASNYLSGFGFDVLNIGNADREDYENTIVIIRGSEQKARKLGELIRCDRVVAGEESESQNIDVTLILGKDFDGKVVR